MTKSAGQLKAAIVGCGKIADGHVEEIQKLGNATVAAVCDREMLMAEQLASRYGIAAHYGSTTTHPFRILDAATQPPFRGCLSSVPRERPSP